MAVQSLGWALATTAVLGLALWVISRVVYYLGVIPLASGLSRFSGGMRWPYYAFLAPGTALHELSHWLACKLMLVRVLEFAPFSPRRDGTLGWVLHEPAGPVRAQVISLAPLAGGMLALYAGARLLMPGLLTMEAAGLVYATPAESLWAAGAYWLQALAAADYGRAGTWLYLYLAFVVGRGMVPSAPDLWQLLGAATALCGGAFLVGLLDASLELGLASQPLVARLAGAALPLAGALNALLVFGLVAVALGAALLIPPGWFLRRLQPAPTRPGPARRRPARRAVAPDRTRR